MNQQYTYKPTLLLVFLFFQIYTYAQPDNDRCENATIMTLGVDSMTCIAVLGDTRGTEDATQVVGPDVCSGSWYTDDVWFKVAIGNEVPESGITIEVRLDPSIETELEQHGMAFYDSCHEGTRPIVCFSDESERRTIEVNTLCLESNKEYFVRLWSAPQATENSGTFSICAYETNANVIPIDTTKVIYQEGFDSDLNGWVSEAITDSYDQIDEIFKPDDWIWTASSCIPNAFGSEVCLYGFGQNCSSGGAAGFPADWYVFGRDGIMGPLDEPPFDNQIGFLVSPSIDLSNESCVNLQWLEAFRGLNGSELTDLGATVEFSIDGGISWRPPSQAINRIDVSSDYDVAYEVNIQYSNMSRKIPLLGAEGQADVKIRFGFNSDFYNWIIDDIKITECTNSDMNITNKSAAISHIQPMSIYQIDTLDFMLDLINLTTNDYENVSVKLDGIDDNDNIVFSDSVRVENFNSDTNAGNVQIPSSFFPGSTETTYEFTFSLLNSNNSEEIKIDKQNYSFETVDENVFRKENGIASRGLTPNFSIDGWGLDNNFSWAIGNIFFATNDIAPLGVPYIFDNISFQLHNYEELIDESIKVWLYKIEDKNFDFIINRDDIEEITPLGFADYLITGTEEGFVTLSLSPFPVSESVNRLILEKNTHYMAVVEHLDQKGNSNGYGPLMRISANVSDQYEASYRNKRNLADNNLSKIRYAHAFLVNPQNHFRIGPSDDPIEGNFDESLVPFIRLGYEPFLGVGVADFQIREFQITPSPTSEFINVSFELEEVNEVQLSIIDLDGRILKTTLNKWNKNDNIRFDVSDFSSGVYLLQVKTDQGQYTEKFVVLK